MFKIFKSRKGYELKDLFGLVLVFLVVAIAIGLGADVLTEIRDTQDNNQATLTDNESLTWAGNNTAISLTTQGDIVAGSETVYNATDKFSTSEYVFNATAATIIFQNTTNATWLTDSLNITYGYLFGSAARNITKYGLTTQITFGKWLPTIALIVIIAIIIGILIVYLARRYT